MVNIDVNPGICGLKTKICVEADEDQTAKIEISSDCQFIKSIGNELKEIDGYAECFSKFGESETYKLAKKYCRHPGCPVPAAIIKGVEVACGLALPKNAEIVIEKK
jgi:hypothetical protein